MLVINFKVKKCRWHLGKNKICTKKKRLIVKLNIYEKSKLSNSVAPGKTHFWIIRKAFFNSLNCQVFSVACHWMLMVVPQMYHYWLTQLKSYLVTLHRLNRCISPVEKKMPAAYYGHSMRTIVRSPAPGTGYQASGIASRDASW